MSRILIRGVAVVAALAVIVSIPTPGQGEPEWLGDYKSLVAQLKSMPGRSWGATISPPDDPLAAGSFTLMIEEDGGLLSIAKYRQQPMNPETRQPIEAVVIDVVMKIRDRDLDGMPDEFRGEPFDPFPGEEILQNGFIKIRDHQDHYAILVQWDTVMGIAWRALSRER